MKRSRASVKMPTLFDVAQLAGVSTAAVSAVLNKGQGKTTRVGERTAQHIRAAAEELGYQANLTARSLVTGQTGLIGFMLAASVGQGFLNPYFASFLQGAEAECRRLGYGLVVMRATVSEAGQFIQSAKLQQRRLDALIVVGEVDANDYLELKSAEIPFVALNTVPRQDIPCLGAFPHPDLLRFALSKGHRRIVFTVDWGNKKNYDGFMAQIRSAVKAEYDLTFWLPDEGQHPNWEPGFGLGRHLFERWMATPPERRPTFIFSNGVLSEFYDELLKAGMGCPADVSLFGDNTFDFHPFPNFSRMRTPHERMGADAVSLLVDAVGRGGAVDPVACAQKTYQASIIQGETVRELKT